MAFFDVNATDTDAGGGSVTISAVSTGNRARFIAFGCTNDGSARVTLRVYDGTAAAGTVRARFNLNTGDSLYYIMSVGGNSVFPKMWFTSGNAIAADLSATGSVRIWGEVVRET